MEGILWNLRVAGRSSLGATCIRKPGAAFTSQMPPPIAR